jgi:hypothetical protein
MIIINPPPPLHLDVVVGRVVTDMAASPLLSGHYAGQPVRRAPGIHRRRARPHGVAVDRAVVPRAGPEHPEPRLRLGVARRRRTRDVAIQRRHVLPMAFPVLAAHVSYQAGGAILAEAGLSFLGLGDPTVMSWGAQLGSAQHFVREAWWMGSDRLPDAIR